MDLIFGERKLAGSLTGSPATGDATLRFSALSGISPMIETVPLDQAAAAYAKMVAGRPAFVWCWSQKMALIRVRVEVK